ncbi:helix-turn-helix transcriptional regulator [Paenibacillus aurantius]|uniref:Helix-turn-helix transcriptional regulator n=1 Tax=Paenibacillus aurantius TaxID=2918900 RepID=A0AA96LA78_9BACL|nr:helix-turn-helix transcriptional regulator [Paenibacillus aurantius]WNQ09528.1 helix-turn-helix transcriptional regulator [Paenibacillus aurantius]
MDRETRRQALSAFLKAKRDKLSPEEAGFLRGTRRRTPGLRREEVAQLAGVSPTWYTWLEQGRDIRMSPEVLDCIAVALRLTNDERKYLLSLAQDTGPGAAVPKEAPPVIGPSLRKIMDELRYCPTILTDRRFSILSWNEAASHVFLDFDQIPPGQRNMIRLLFTRKELRRLAVNWEQFTKAYLSIFRAYYGQYLEDPWYGRFLAEMKETHPEFGLLWEQSEVRSAPEVLLEFRHAKAGKMLFALTSLQVQGDSDLRCSIYTPAPDSTTEGKLQKLMERVNS